MKNILIILGRTRDDKGVAMSVYFDNQAGRTCAGWSTAGTKKSDYEIWRPNHTSCVMGKKVYIIRRKKTSRCWDDQPIDSEKFVTICPCEDSDWECDFGFHHVKMSKTCEPIDSRYEINTKNKTNSTYFFISTLC